MLIEKIVNLKLVDRENIDFVLKLRNNNLNKYISKTDLSLEKQVDECLKRNYIKEEY